MSRKDVMIVTGAGQISMAIARRVGYGKKIVMGDKNIDNAKTIAEIMNNAGFDVEPVEMDLSSRESILKLIAKAQEYGEIKMLVNGAGVSPSQAPIEAILKVDLYGTAVLLEEVGKVIVEGGCGVTISSQSGWRMPQLTAEEDAAFATTPTEELLDLEILQPENIKDTLHAYQMAKRCNEKRVMAQSVEWGKRGARLNDIAPGIIVTPLAMDEFNGPRGDFYKNMFAKCPAGRPGTADEVANVAELLMSDKGAFITGSTFLIDGGATSSYYYGPLKPEMFDVTEHTLRFYTDKGLLPCERDGGNRRIFNEESVNWMQGIKCLKGCGASIEDIQEYCRLCLLEESEENLRARYEIILKQRVEAYKRLEEAKATVKYMDDKVAHYEAILAGVAPDDTNPKNWTVGNRPKH